MLPEKRQELLTEHLERSLASARALAAAHREQRDQYVSRIQFGLVALNGATLVTVVNAASQFPGLNHSEMLAAIGIFASGVYFAGMAAMTQLTRHIEAAGAAAARATIYETAISLSQSDPSSPRFDEAFEQLREQEAIIFKYSPVALRLQSASAVCWLGGLAFTAIADQIVKLPGWWPL